MGAGRWLRGLRRAVGVGALLGLLGVWAAPGVRADDSSDAPAAAPAPWVRSIRCPVLYTHEVASQATMRRFLVGLLAAGYQPIGLGDLDAAMSGDSDPPPRCVMLTFDDGLLSQYLNAAPVLMDLQLPAVFFVLPGFADGVHRYMGAAEFQDLVEMGFDVELHTCNHPNLPLLARSNLNAMDAELQDCRRMLSDITGQPVDYLAYPDGAYDATVLNAVAAFGFRAAFTTRAAALLSASSPFTLPRIRYDPSEPLARVLARMRAAGG